MKAWLTEPQTMPRYYMYAVGIGAAIVTSAIIDPIIDLLHKL
jgi:hypothetical protein